MKRMFRPLLAVILVVAMIIPCFPLLVSADDYTVGTYEPSGSKGLNIRSGASTSYAVVGAIPYGTSFMVTEVDGNWGKTTCNGATGWVCLDYATKVSSNTSSTGSSNTSDIMVFMQTTYDAALRKAHKTTFDGWCGACVGRQLQVLGVNRKCISDDGNKTYNIYAEMSETSGGYIVNKYPASDYSLEEALNVLNDASDTYTYAVLGFNKGSDSDGGQDYGHTLLIYAVIDGTIYYTESYGTACRSKSIDNFCKSYSNRTINGKEVYKYDGMIWFTPPTYDIEVGAFVDDEYTTSLNGYATFDVYINGTLAQANVDSFCNAYPSGTKYEIKNIKVAAGYTYVSGGALSGTIGNADVCPRMKLAKQKFVSTEWLLSDAYYDETNQHFVLTEDYSSWQTGSVWYNHSYDNNFTLEMDYYTGSSDRSLGGADGIVVAFYANYSYEMSSGEDMGFTGCGGYGVELDTYQNDNQGDPSHNHIALIKENVGTHLVTNTLPESEDEQWHHLKVVVEDGVCTAYVDGNEKFSHAVEKTGYGWIGITSATGNGHNLHAVKNIIVTGDSSTSIDGRYLDLNLLHGKVSNNCTSDPTNGVYEYEIAAEIKNSADATAHDTVVTLDLREGLRVADEVSLSVSLGDIPSGESVCATWTVYADWPESNIAANYGVTATIGDSVSLRQESYIYLVARNENDHTLTNLDWWNFRNEGKEFTNLETNEDGEYIENYYISDEDWEALTAGLSEIEIDSMQKERDSHWGGSCYGMSVAVALAKMGVIELSTIPGNPSYIAQATKSNDDDLESFINFYQLQQKTIAASNNNSQFAIMDTAEQLAVIEDLADQVSVGGYPFLLCFSGDGWGHAVVAYGIDHGEYSFGGFLGLFATKYDSRILIYDCNNLSSPENSYLYFNSGTDEWYIPLYEDANKLEMACNDISILDCVNYGIATTNFIARLEFEGEYGYLLNYNGSPLEINADTDMRSEGIISFYDANILADGTYGSSTLTLTLPDLTADYTVTPLTDSAAFSMYYENTALSVDFDSAEQIRFNAAGGVLAEGISGDYSITLLQNDGVATTPWYKTTIRGTDGEDISLIQTSNGVIVTGTNLKNVSIETTDKSGTHTTRLSTDCDSVLLTSNAASGNVPMVMLDSDGDGSYESEYNDKYTVRFDANGGSGNMDALKNVTAGVVVLPDNGFTPPSGMKFKGWSESSAGEVIAGTEYTVADDVTLYAIWEEIEEVPDTPQPDSETTEESMDTGMIKLMAIGIVMVGAAIGVILLIVKKKKKK